MQSRREFLITFAGAAGAVALPKSLSAIQTTQSFAGPMEQGAYRPVKLPAKPGAAPSMTDEKRDDLEHKIACQCGCVLDIYTCRTTDFACGVSPAMHGDVMALVTGGYNASEILNAFQNVYGERVLMSPLKEGFNWLGYLMPFAALITGGVVVGGLIRRWGARAAAEPRPAVVSVNATQEELDALKLAMRNDA
jgi:cytochrome c-type biogenesis protein CcmH